MNLHSKNSNQRWRQQRQTPEVKVRARHLAEANVNHLYSCRSVFWNAVVTVRNEASEQADRVLQPVWKPVILVVHGEAEPGVEV